MARAKRAGGTSDEEPQAAPAEKRQARNADAAWEAARRRVADRNAQVRKQGRAERREHERRIAAYRDARGR